MWFNEHRSSICLPIAPQDFLQVHWLRNGQTVESVEQLLASQLWEARMMISTISGSFGALVQNAMVNKSVLDMTEVFIFGV